MKTIDHRTDFTILRYANCWEDPVLLLQGLCPQPGDRILSIGSAGDNSFSLLVTDPELVVAADVSGTQLALIGLKKAAMLGLDYDDLLGFLGFRPMENRLDHLYALKGLLPPQVFAYWSARPEAIRNGIIHQGKFEQYFHVFVRKVLPWIHRQETVRQLFAPKTVAEQADFYHRRWNTWRWRLLFKLFFSRAVMGRLGRDPEFMREVKVHVGRTIFSQAERQLGSVTAQTNSMLRYNLTGDFGELLPHYLLPENHAVICSRLDRLVCHEGFAEEAIPVFGTFQRMNLSNIFEYMDIRSFRAVARKFAAGLSPGGRVAYWNLLVPRRITALPDTGLVWLELLSHDLKALDRGFYYRDFIVEEAYG